MAKNKTTETNKSVSAFIEKIKNESKRDDSFQIIRMMTEVTGFEPKMWGPSMIGFGTIHYKYESGHEGDMPLAAFSPRSPEIVVYVSVEFENRKSLLAKLGKQRPSKVAYTLRNWKTSTRAS